MHIETYVTGNEQSETGEKTIWRTLSSGIKTSSCVYKTNISYTWCATIVVLVLHLML